MAATTAKSTKAIACPTVIAAAPSHQDKTGIGRDA
jgi:hypothetical protein